MKVMCDTNILIHPFNNNEKVVTGLEQIGFDNIVHLIIHHSNGTLPRNG